MTTRLHILALLTLILQGCAPPPPWIETQPQWVQDFAYETGLDEDILLSGPGPDGNLVFVELQGVYGTEVVKGPCRVALRMVAEDGTKHLDHFADIDAQRGDGRRNGPTALGTGDIRMRTWIMWPLSDHEAKIDLDDEDAEEYVKQALDTHALHRDFPEFWEERIELTFKEFPTNRFFLRDVPKGYAYIWLQADMAEQRLSLFPTLVELRPESDDVTRASATFTRMWSFGNL